jgi:SpoVK/Ycf46/Vps4 family AAA+-type ATPase
VRCRAPLVEPKPETVEIEFWYETGDCLESTKRRIDVPRWDAIAANYPSSVREKVALLVEMGPPSVGGRLLLWHGPPGTGKTTAIRALVREWSTWCRALFIVDAERFLGQGRYLMSVLLGAADPGDDEEGPG